MTRRSPGSCIRGGRPEARFRRSPVPDLDRPAAAGDSMCQLLERMVSSHHPGSGACHMRSIIQQSVILAASAQALYAMYLDPAVHAEITGAPVTIGGEPGAPFRAFDGNLSGSMLTVQAPTLIVQSWRSTHFNDDDPDSTLILSFTSQGDA